ncbi:hypothetical protein RHMOL_Rhmol10G0164600 [Rhododendron molle]|uniref:Uncharacterized protein n=1 Tax=Rhododendron molle TaxID=49168 RepID=A0ACC0M4Q2_RHOML|nr:hypothetical protein RHMOL_Rhmol10G0164600 [Rhododendron molle]
MTHVEAKELTQEEPFSSGILTHTSALNGVIKVIHTCPLFGSTIEASNPSLFNKKSDSDRSCPNTFKQ